MLRLSKMFKTLGFVALILTDVHRNLGNHIDDDGERSAALFVVVAKYKRNTDDFRD